MGRKSAHDCEGALAELNQGAEHCQRFANGGEAYTRAVEPGESVDGVGYGPPAPYRGKVD